MDAGRRRLVRENNPGVRARRRLAPRAALLLFLCLPAAPAIAQESVSALPAPVTRSLYRSHWFEFLNAHLEDDSKSAALALAEMRKAARAVGVSRLSDFSRTAIHEGRKAEALGKPERAARAYAAGTLLDDGNFDAAVSRVEFLLRWKAYAEAARAIPAAAHALLATRESRLSLASAGAVWLAFAVVASFFGAILALLAKNSSRIAHDLREFSRRLGGHAVAPALCVALGPFAFGLGPGWVLLYWGVLLFAYAVPRERLVLAGGLVLLGLLVPLSSAISRENVIERSPLWVAAVDLEERREDASAEDGLRQASAVFPEDSDVWYLFGMYAERSGDSERAIASYDRAIQADSNDYRPFLNRGNVHFQEGDFQEAIRDYETAAQKAAKAAEAQYNLSIARGEAYDFDGQSAAMARARALSAKDVVAWSEHTTLSRVVSAGYPLSRARRRIEQWNRQAKSKRLPGHAPPLGLAGLFLSPFALGPWVALCAAVALARVRARGSIATECTRCGAPVCDSCRRFGDNAFYCTTCVRLHIRKEEVGIAVHAAHAEQAARRTRARDSLCRVLSAFLPGTHRIFSERTAAGVLTMAMFFFLVGIAVIGGRFFNPRQLAPTLGGHFGLLVPATLAAALWASSLASSWRNSHGS